MHTDTHHFISGAPPSSASDGLLLCIVELGGGDSFCSVRPGPHKTAFLSLFWQLIISSGGSEESPHAADFQLPELQRPPGRLLFGQSDLELCSGPPMLPRKSTCSLLHGFHQPPTAQSKHSDRRSNLGAHFSARWYKLRLLQLMSVWPPRAAVAGRLRGRVGGGRDGTMMEDCQPGVATAPHAATEDKRAPQSRTPELQPGAFFQFNLPAGLIPGKSGRCLRLAAAIRHKGVSLFHLLFVCCLFKRRLERK